MSWPFRRLSFAVFYARRGGLFFVFFSSTFCSVAQLVGPKRPRYEHAHVFSILETRCPHLGVVAGVFLFLHESLTSENSLMACCMVGVALCCVHVCFVCGRY